MKDALNRIQQRIRRRILDIPESRRPVVLGILIGIVAAAGLYYGWQRNERGGVRAEEGENALEERAAPRLFVPDQLPGMNAIIRELSMRRSVWVAIHEDDGGKPGKILGARRFPTGSASHGEIELLREMTAGLYYAMVHEDDGILGFKSASDMPTVENGLPVMARFVVGANPEAVEE